MTNTSATLYCYGNIVTGGNWGGVSLGYLLQQTGMEPASASIDFIAIDGYRVSIPLWLAMQAQVIIAYQKDDLPLSEGLRLVLPGENGNLWIKSISTIAMSTVEVSIQQVDIAQPALMGVLSSFNLNGPSSPLQQEPIQPSPITMPKNETSTKSMAPPVNVTQLPPATSTPKNSNPEDLGFSFPIVIVCGIGFGTIVALLAVVYVTQRKNVRIQRQDMYFHDR
jgi:DMSO/TMAO reductase YedYZ molybdopterin-dependent catalytic subunit